MTTVTKLKHPRAAAWEDAAKFLRGLADQFEAGSVTEAVVVYNNTSETYFGSWGHFDDRWRLLGALEYAKEGVHKN